VQRRTTPFDLACSVVIVVGLAASLAAAAQRYRAEQRNRRVEVAVDYAEAERIAASQGVPTAYALARLRDAGATSVAITARTVADLAEQGLASVSGSSRMTTVRLANQALLTQVAREWEARGVRTAPGVQAGSGPLTLLWCGTGIQRARLYRGSFAALSLLDAGFPDQALRDVRASGLGLVARLGNFPGASESTLSRVLGEASAAGARTVICTGTEVLGHYGLHKEAAEAFLRTGVAFGQVEFAKQKGDEKLGIALKGRFVRVHSISEGEMGTLSEADAIERFVRAARERNIRLCYVRMLTMAGTDALDRNSRYLQAIVSGIGRRGLLRTGPARQFDDPVLPPFVPALIGVGVGALATRVLVAIWPGAAGRRRLLLVMLCIACGLLAAAGESGRRWGALVAALAAPTLASLPLIRAVGARDDAAPQAPLSPAQALLSALKMLASASAVTFLGAASVVGLLASRPFMVKVSQFLGIKAAHALPILAVGVLIVAGLPAMSGGAETWRRMRERASCFARRPVQVGSLILTLAILAALMLAVMRTGNEPGVGVSGWELRARSLLDATLPARPRTKEFLLGHPAFVVAVVLALRNRRRWAAPAGVLGVLGQASVLNTFCHIHTPLALSAVRAATGLVLGLAVGAAAAALAVRLLPEDDAANTG